MKKFQKFSFTLWNTNWYKENWFKEILHDKIISLGYNLFSIMSLNKGKFLDWRDLRQQTWAILHFKKESTKHTEKDAYQTTNQPIISIIIIYGS